MSSNRKRKKATRHQPVAHWEAGTARAASVATSVPVRADGQNGSRVGPGEAAARTTAARTGRREQPVPATSLATISDAIDTMVHALDVEPARPLGATSQPEPTKSRGWDIASPKPAEAAEGPADPAPPPAEEPTRPAPAGAPSESANPRPADGPARPRRPRALTVLAASVLVLLCAAGGLYFAKVATRNLNGQDALQTSSGPARPSASDAGGSSPSAATSPPASNPTRAALDYVPGGSTGPGLTTPGVLVQVFPDATGDLEVVERVMFAETSSILTLAPPVTTGMTKAAVPQKVRVVELQVSADGSVVSTGPTGLTRSTRLALPEGTHTVEMRYRVQGAAVRSIPSTPGRALVLLPPISTGSELRDLPAVVEVQRGEVRNMQCPGLPAGEQLCGRASEGRWYAVKRVPADTALLAQLDLPDPVSG